jgi:uncharacterized lipoprotein YddW (UPF0748 family)
MGQRKWSLALCLALALLCVAAAFVQAQSEAQVYFYLQGQAHPVSRALSLTGEPEADAASLITELTAGPTADEQFRGLRSPLPAGTELGAVEVSDEQVTVTLRIPQEFLSTQLDAYASDAIVEQMSKTLSTLGLRHLHLLTEDRQGTPLPISDFLPRPTLPVPATPANSEPYPERFGSPTDLPEEEPEYGGQPPAPGQGQPMGALSGTTVWLSAGHGWYWADAAGGWTTQRGNNYGIVEDLSNAEAVNYYLARYLWNSGADVWLVRDRGLTEHEIIVDNDAGAPGYLETGTWRTSGTPGYQGGTYRWRSSFTTTVGTATWTPDLPEAGWYPVWAWYLHGGNRSSDARYEIHHSGGTTTASVSQDVHGQTWRYLGEYHFAAGTDGHVTLLDQSDDLGQVVIADAIRFGGGLGSIPDGDPSSTSGRPRWEEAAKYWAQYQGAPPEAYANDVTSRPLYAEWETAKGYPGEVESAVYVSWHSNAGGASGTSSFIHDSEPTPGSTELQDWIHAEVVSDLRASWNPDWNDLGQFSANFGELRELITIPGVLLEVAFHDSENPGDADDLREPVFRQVAARAVYQGIVKYHAARRGEPLTLLPEPPERLVARNTALGQVTLTWAPPPCCDGAGGDAATSYKVYHSTSGRGFDNGLTTSATSLSVSGLPPGSLHFFRVTALNEGGESFPTPVVPVRTPQPHEQVDLLVVDGFDRLDQTAMIPQSEPSVWAGTAWRMLLERMNRHDYSIEHGEALSGCGFSFDGAVNEAAEAADVALNDYPALDWFVGEDSVADAALSEAERAALAAYLDAGGRLLISGAEIGYDLVEMERDPAFFQNYLKAAYLGDDAGTYEFSGLTDTFLQGIAGRFDDSTQGSYDVGYPDQLGNPGGSTVVAQYIGGSGGGAAVAFEGHYRLVHFGFPLETVTDSSVRSGLICSAANWLLESPQEPSSATPRIINPGFEQGLGQSAWQATASDGKVLFYPRQDLPVNVEPHSGDWLAWLGSHTFGISTTAYLTQAIGLPSGEPTATLTLNWLVHGEGGPPASDDRLTAGIYDLGGGLLLAELLAVGSDSPAGTWQTSHLDASAFAGQTIQIAFRAVSTNTAFFVDDVSLTTEGPLAADEFRALWVDAYHVGIKTRQQIDELIETAQAGNFNALVVQVRRRGDTYYPSSLDPWAPDAAPDFDALAYLIERAHAAQIEVHAWATTLAIWGGSSPPSAPGHTFNDHGPGASGRDYWLMISENGLEAASNVYYLDPGHPDVVDYTVAIYTELAANYELDGLHLDRVRYAGQEWGYNPTSLARFQAQTEREDRPSPTDTEWLQWRRDQVSALVRKIYLAVAIANPRLRLSGALSVVWRPPDEGRPWEATDPYSRHLQDWRSWLEEGILDLGLPMVYRDEDGLYASQFDGWHEWTKDHQYGRGAAVGTGLYLNTVANSMAQWLRVRQPSAAGHRALGLVGYSYATPSSDGTPRRAFVNTAVTQVFTQPATSPRLPWKDAPTVGHLAGQLSQDTACRSLDGLSVSLSGTDSRLLRTNGSGWFGAVDLAPGEYLLTVQVASPDTTVEVPLSVTAGVVTEQEIALPPCATERVYLPLVLR